MAKHNSHDLTHVSSQCFDYQQHKLANEVTLPMSLQEPGIILQDSESVLKSTHYLSTERPLEELVCYNLSEIIKQPTSSKFAAVNPLKISSRRDSSQMLNSYYDKETLSTGQLGVKSTNDTTNEEIQNIGNSKRKGKEINFVTVPDKKVKSRALAVLPAILHSKAGVISPWRTLQQYMKFGPVKGVLERLTARETAHLVKECVLFKKPIFIIKNENGSFTRIDVSDVDKSNWIGLLQLGDQTTANIWLHQEGEELFALTTRCIERHVPLLLGYTKEYAEKIGIPSDQPIMDLYEEMSRGQVTQHKCDECNFTTTSLVSLERHNMINHQDDDKLFRKKKNRCRYCGNRFSKLFSLRRHMNLYCPKRKPASTADISTESTEEERNTTSNTTPNISLNILPEDDNKLPSDESLQNYTNILDFSTNLFDTDRIANLDMSGSLKSDNDFLSYGGKDDNRLAHDFDFTEGLTNSGTNTNVGSKPVKKNSTPKSSSQIICQHCVQFVQESKYRQHVKVCGAASSSCSCGRVFSSRERLAVHVFRDHPAHCTDVPGETPTIQKSTAKKKNKVNKENTTVAANETEQDVAEETITLKCQHCGVVFKRRGMLVNHLVRSHGAAGGAAAAGLPLLQRLRRYPCPVCPKLYQANHKRDRHVRLHHPGIEWDRQRAVAGGTRRRQPAACWACPRQYASRAKLLQHARAHHPHQAPPPENKAPTSPT